MMPEQLLLDWKRNNAAASLAVFLLCITFAFTNPFLPSSGIKEIMRMTLDVQNGTVHNTNYLVCMEEVRTQNAKK